MGLGESNIVASTFLHFSPGPGRCSWGIQLFCRKNRLRWIFSSCSSQGFLVPTKHLVSTVYQEPRSQLKTSEASSPPSTSCWAHYPQLGRKSPRSPEKWWHQDSPPSPSAKFCSGAPEATRPPIVLTFPLLVLNGSLGVEGLVGGQEKWEQWNERQECGPFGF